jgi:hypothetical protein
VASSGAPSLAQRGDFKGAAGLALCGWPPVAAARCTCGVRSSGVMPRGAVAGSVVVDGEFAEAQLDLCRLAPSRCQRWGSRRKVQTIQNGADCFGILDDGQEAHPIPTARTREGIDPEHALEKLCPR